MKSRKYALSTMVLPIGILALIATGCSSKSSSDKATSAASAAQTQTQQAILDNPNIPPQAKAALQQTVQGKNEQQMPVKH